MSSNWYTGRYHNQDYTLPTPDHSSWRPSSSSGPTSPTRYYQQPHEGVQAQPPFTPVSHHRSLSRRQDQYTDGPDMVSATPPLHQQQPLSTRSSNHMRGSSQNNERPDRRRRRGRIINPFPLGTREDVEDPDYQSPIGAMFGRAWDRYRNAEQHRQAQEIHDVHSHAHPIPYGYHAPGYQTFGSASQAEIRPNRQPFLTAQDIRNRRSTQPPRPSPPALPAELVGSVVGSTGQYASESRAQQNRLRRPAVHSDSNELAADFARLDTASRANALSTYLRSGDHRLPVVYGYVPVEAGEPVQERIQTFDNQPRPPPRRSESMQLDMSCKICFEQIADMVLLPCRHVYMCHWCADISIPAKTEAMLHVPRDRHAKCDLCRKQIKYRYQVFLPDNST